MLSILALAFLLPAMVLITIPMLAIFNSAYDGDQALSAVFAIVLSIPGSILVGFDVYRRGWRKAKVGIAGLIFAVLPLIALVVGAGFCELTNLCSK